MTYAYTLQGILLFTAILSIHVNLIEIYAKKELFILLYFASHFSDN